MKRIRL